MKSKIKTDKLHLAQYRYYEVGKGSEIPPISAYCILAEVNGNYYNVLNPFLELPVYGRSNVSNTTRDGEYFGSKIVLKSGEEKDGLCYIMEFGNMEKKFKNKEVSVDEIESYVFNSPLFFWDRLDILEEKGDISKAFLSYSKGLKKDYLMKEKFSEYLEAHDKNYVLKK